MTDSYIIKKEGFTKSDIESIVELHKTEIGQGFISSLGNKALGLLFENAAQSQSGLLIMCSDQGSREIIGFICGAYSTKKFYKDFIKKKAIKATILILPKLFSINTIKKLFETLFYPQKTELTNLPDAELLDFAVSTNFQGKGISKMLFDLFVESMRKNHVGSFKITTGESLVRAQKFYEKSGALKVGEIEVHKGQKTFIYKFDL